MELTLKLSFGMPQLIPVPPPRPRPSRTLLARLPRAPLPPLPSCESTADRRRRRHRLYMRESRRRETPRTRERRLEQMRVRARARRAQKKTACARSIDSNAQRIARRLARKRRKHVVVKQRAERARSERGEHYEILQARRTRSAAQRQAATDTGRLPRDIQCFKRSSARKRPLEILKARRFRCNSIGECRRKDDRRLQLSSLSATRVCKSTRKRRRKTTRVSDAHRY